MRHEFVDREPAERKQPTLGRYPDHPGIGTVTTHPTEFTIGEAK